MLIVSEYHDYYDTAIGFGGVDKAVVFQRKTYSVDDYSSIRARFDWKILPHSYLYRTPSHIPVEVIFFYLGFCGKIFLGAEVTGVKGHGRDTHYVYSSEALTTVLSGLEAKLDELWDSGSPARLWERYLRHIKNISENIFETAKTPIFVLYPKYFVVCPRLEPLGFYQVVSAYEAYQELYMYISNFMLKPEVTPRPISDKIMRDMKGFDDMSFKQYAPGDKKKRRKENKRRKNEKT